MFPCDTWTMEKVTRGKMNSRVRGSFLSLEGNQTIRWEKKRKEKEEGKKREKKKKRKEMGKGKQKEKMRKKNKKWRTESHAWRRGERKQKRNDTSLHDLLQTGGRNASGKETKLFHATRATRGYRNSNFSSKFQKVGVSPTLVISCLVAM